MIATLVAALVAVGLVHLLGVSMAPAVIIGLLVGLLVGVVEGGRR